MFQSLSDRLSNVFSKLTGKGALSEADVTAAMREVRVALLEADVALPVVKAFVERVKEKAVGEEVIASVSPGQMVVKIVHDELQVLLGDDARELNLNVSPPAVMMMVGLQGSGKTTSTGKLALHVKEKKSKKILLASLDVQRPAAQEQLAKLAEQVGVTSLPIVKGENPEAITKRALEMAKLEGFDVLMLDTAGRLHVDEALMQELQVVRDLAKPTETLLVADSLTGQDAVNVAEQFNEQVGVSGIILTRVDGDARGGAALSMKQVTGQPILFLGVGEKLTELEVFHPERVASRILDMGDIVSLVERAAEMVDEKDAEKMAKKFAKGEFDLEDLANQLKQMNKMGGMGAMLGMLPGMGKMKAQMGDQLSKVDDKAIARQIAIIESMTLQERRFPKLLNGSRKRRVAMGAGVEVPDVNRLLKQHKQMHGMMKKLKKLGPKKLMRQMDQLQHMMPH